MEWIMPIKRITNCIGIRPKLNHNGIDFLHRRLP